MATYAPTNIDSYAPTNIDRRQCHRTVELKVLVLGLSRTGTDSIRKALICLGYNDTYHGFEASLENPRDCEMWLGALRAKYDGKGEPFGRQQFDQLLGHCQAICDAPATCFTPELLKAYPDAKVVLSNRDVDDWYLSVNSAILENINSPKTKILGLLTSLTRSPNRWTRPVWKSVFSDYYDGNFEKNGKRVFQEHYDMVRDLVPADRLLEYEVEQGWLPLCDFLEKDCPDIAFPNGNNKQDLEARIRGLTAAEVDRLKGIAYRYSGMEACQEIFSRCLRKSTHTNPPNLHGGNLEKDCSSLSSSTISVSSKSETE